MIEFKPDDKSRELMSAAKKLIPGGVNSPVRAFGSVGTEPPFIASGAGCKITDVDGKTYTDYVASWGPLILGHAPECVKSAVLEAINDGSSFGAPTESEVKLARLVTEAFPSIEMLRLVNSGTEAAMSALRLARGYTGRSKIVKFIGCYHGHVDSMLASAGSGVATLAIPGTPGVPEGHIADTLLLPYNDLAAFKSLMATTGDEIAAVIVEPVAGNMGVVPPAEGFLETLRDECTKQGSVLIFDEVITGFRVALGGMQERTGIKADLTMLGKIIGGGLPVGAFGGKREIMEYLAPIGDVYQAGTLSGNPLATAAGIAMLTELNKPGVYESLEARASMLAEGIVASVTDAGIPATLNRVGSMMTAFFNADEVTNYEQASKSDTTRYGKYFRLMLGAGIYIAPSQFEAAFVSTAHTEEEINMTLDIVRKVHTSLA